MHSRPELHPVCRFSPHAPTVPKRTERRRRWKATAERTAKAWRTTRSGEIEAMHGRVLQDEVASVGRMTARQLLVVGIAALVWSVLPSPAGAIPNTCPTAGPDAGTVNIDEPTPGATFAGQVTVRGRASAPIGLTRVELFAGEALKDFQVFEPGVTNLQFFLRFDVAGVPSDTPTLSVVACGGAPGNAVRGIASIDVRVNRAAVVAAPPIAITPVEPIDDRPGAESRTGPAWVGAAFGLAGLAGLVAATRLRGARGAIAPSPGAAAAKPGRRRSPVRPGPEAGQDGTAPPRPSPARRWPRTAASSGPSARRADGRADATSGPPAGAAEPATRRADGRGRAAGAPAKGGQARLRPRGRGRGQEPGRPGPAPPPPSENGAGGGRRARRG